jgi:hypothetical protein
MTDERDPEVEHDQRLVERVREEQRREDERIKREEDRGELNERQNDEEGPPAFPHDRTSATNLAERRPCS